MKKCFKCGINQPLSNFYKHPQMADGTVGKCKECNKKDIRKNYQENILEKRQYENYRNRFSISRIFMLKYFGIKQRCTRVRSSGRKYRVFGTKYITKKEWLEWCYEEKNYKKFVNLYNDWVNSGFQEKYSPSIDRINNNKGYIKNNLQWLTKTENCSKFTK